MPYRSSNARVAATSTLSGRSRGIFTKSSPASAAPGSFLRPFGRPLARPDKGVGSEQHYCDLLLALQGRPDFRPSPRQPLGPLWLDDNLQRLTRACSRQGFIGLREAVIPADE